MCARCITEKRCECRCIENLSIAQEEFYPFGIIKVNCDECEHGVSSTRNDSDTKV